MRARIIILIFLGLCIRSFAGLEYNSVTTNKVVAAGPNIVFTFGNGGTLTISSPNQLPENAPGALTNDGFGNIGWQVGGSGGGGGPIAVNLGQLFTNALGQLSIISGATTTNNFLYEHSPGAIHLTNDNTAISLIIYYDTSFNQDVNQLFSFYSPLQTNAWEMLAGSNVWSMNFVSLNGPDTVTNIIAITNGATPSITSFVPFDVTTENVSGTLTGIGTIQNMVLLNDTNTGVQIYTNSIYTNIFGPTGITNIWGGTTSVYTSGTQQTTNATGNSTFTPTTFAFTNGSSTLIWNGTSLIINGVSINTSVAGATNVYGLTNQIVIVTNLNGTITVSNNSALFAYQLLSYAGGQFLFSAGNNSISGAHNVGLGESALASDISGSDNTAVGAQALNANTTGQNNTAFGDLVLQFNQTGSDNTGIGASALEDNVSGSFNIGIGFTALEQNQNGAENIAIGRGAQAFATGTNNIGIGWSALSNLGSGTNDDAVGYFAGHALDGAESNDVAIANSGVAGMSGTIWIGTSGQHTNTVIAGVINGNGAGLTGLPSLSLVGQVAIGNLTNMMYWLTNTTPGYAPVKFLSVDANDALAWTNASASSFGSGQFVGNITNAANYTTNISGTNYFVNGTNTWASTYTNIYDGVTNIQTSSGISFGGTVTIPGLNVGQLVGVGAGNSLVSVTIGSGLQLVSSVLSATGGGSFTLFFPTNNFQAGSVLTNEEASSVSFATNLYVGKTNFANYAVVTNRLTFLSDNQQIGDSSGTLAFFNPTSASYNFGGSAFGDTLGTINAGTLNGAVPVTDLNGGAGASSSTYWRGDGTWNTPSGGSGIAVQGGQGSNNILFNMTASNFTSIATPGGYAITVNNRSSGSPVFEVDDNGNINGGFTPSSTMYIGGMTVLNNLIVDGSLEELAAQTANTIKAGPASGSAAAPTYRAMVQADLPSSVPALGAANTFTSSMTIPVLFVKATMATAPQITIISVITNSSSNYVINFTATNVTAGTSPFGITNFWTFSTGAGTNQHATMMGSTHGKSLGSTVDTFTYPGWCYEFTNTGSTYGCLGSISNNPTFEGIQPPTVETAVATSVGYGPYFTPVSSTATTWTTAGTIYVSW